MAVLTDSATARLAAYLLPRGDEAVRGVRGVRIRQRGEIRSGPAARWLAFEAEEHVDATRSGFRWDARLGSNLLMSVRATDALEDGRGSLVVKKGPVRLVNAEGPELDAGELQRYLAYVSICPAMLRNHRFLELSGIDPGCVRVRDTSARVDATVDVHVGDDGAPVVTRAIRPMLVGTKAVPTPWFTCGRDAGDYDGMRVWRTLEASWHPPAGAFTYIRIEILSYEIIR